MAAGHARLQVRETIIEVDRPEIVEGADARSLAPSIRRLAARRGYRCLRLHTVASMPGSFSHLEGHAVPPTAGEPIPIPAEEPIGVHVEPAIEPEPRTQPRPSGEPEPVGATPA